MTSFSGVPGSPTAGLLVPGAPLPSATPVPRVVNFTVGEPAMTWAAYHGVTTWSATEPLG